MIIDIYHYIDYKKVILSWIDHPTNKGSGARKSLAEALSCQTPFISHVLNGDYRFSPEQALACANWMGMNEKETQYFTLLVQWARAGTAGLKAYVNKQIQQLRQDETLLKKKVLSDDSLSAENQSLYYSAWYYCAIHMALLNKDMQSINSLEKHFSLPKKKIVSIIDFFIKIGLVEEKNGRLTVVRPSLHLENNSPLLTQHHFNWRLKALETLQEKSGDPDSTHLNYSGAISLAAEDYDWIKQKLSALLKEIANRVKDSKDEKVICLNFDCFEI